MPDIDYGQYAGAALDDPVLLALVTMPVNNRDEAGAMLPLAPRIAAHLRAEGLVNPIESAGATDHESVRASDDDRTTP